MSHITKMGVRNKIKPAKEEEQCGFVEGKGRVNDVEKLWKHKKR